MFVIIWSFIYHNLTFEQMKNDTAKIYINPSPLGIVFDT